MSDERPVSPRRAATRARLLDAASEAFAERGLYGTSVEDVCDRAGFTRGAFYSNFSSREDLAIALAEQRATVLQERLRELTASDAPLSPTELLHGVLDLWRDDEQERSRGALLHMELSLHAVRDRAAGEAWRAHLEATVAQVAALIGSYRERSGVELPIGDADLARLLHAVFLAGATERLVAGAASDGGLPLEQALVTLVEHGVTRERPGEA